MSAAAAAMGKKGGAARASRMTPEQRSESAKKAALARWRVPGERSRKRKRKLKRKPG